MAYDNVSVSREPDALQRHAASVPRACTVRAVVVRLSSLFWDDMDEIRNVYLKARRDIGRFLPNPDTADFLSSLEWRLERRPDGLANVYIYIKKDSFIDRLYGT